MRKAYVTCVRIQYTLWALYLCSLLLLYALGFFVDILSLRWFVIPETVGVVYSSIALSLVIVIIFIVQRVFGKDVEAADGFGVFGALPSILILGSTLLYLFSRVFG